MPRQARLVFPGHPHHVTQRGNYRQKVFENEADFRRYCYWFNEYCGKFKVQVLAYCLMENHVHFIVTPEDHQGMSQLFKIVHAQYSLYKHRIKSKTGHLWQGRFYSSVLGQDHILKVLRYVERNPVRAGLVKTPKEYVWSSAREHLGLELKPIIKSVGFEKILNLLEGQSWKDYIEIDDPQTTEEFRKKFLKNSPVGTEHFVSQLEQAFGCNLKNKKMGRPKK